MIKNSVNLLITKTTIKILEILLTKVQFIEAKLDKNSLKLPKTIKNYQK